MNFKVSVRDTRTATMKRIAVVGAGKTTLAKLAFPGDRPVASWTAWQDTVGHVVDVLLEAAEELADVKGEEVTVKIDAQYSLRAKPNSKDDW